MVAILIEMEVRLVVRPCLMVSLLYLMRGRTIRYRNLDFSILAEALRTILHLFKSKYSEK